MRKIFTFLICLLVLNGCGSTVPVLKPFKLDIQQGNLVTSKMLLQLRPGMTKSQVRYIMGTPLIVDSFHKDRWDYFYQMRQAGKVIEQRRVILDFEKDLLTKVRGDVVPQGSANAVAGEVTTGAKTTAELLKEKEDDKGLLDRFKFWKKDAETDTTKAVAVEEPAKAESVKPKAEEKSWVDKLKFWKKDEAQPASPAAIKPIEAPVAVVAVPAAAVTEKVAPTASEEAPSVLAVPIGAEVFTQPVAEPEAKQVESKAKAAEIEVKPVELAPEPVKLVPVKPMPEPVKPVPAPEKIEQPKVVTPVPVKPTPVPTPAPSKAKQPALTNRQVLSNKQDGKMIFRLDRTLKTELLDETPPPPVVEPAAQQPVEQPVEKAAKLNKKSSEEPLPEESEPSFFDKMLEKIGF